MAEATNQPLSDEELSARASGIDKRTTIDYREAASIIWRSAQYIRFFPVRYVTKLVMKTLSYAIPLAIIPWPAKILIDHVVLGAPIAEATAYPAYVRPFLAMLQGMGPFEILVWLALVGVVLVIAIGSYAVGYEDELDVRLVGGQDYATQTETSIHGGKESTAGGIWGYIEWRLGTRLIESLNHTIRGQLFSRIRSLSITQLEDQRIGDSMYRVMYDSPQITEIFYEITHTPLISAFLYTQALLTVLSAYPDSPEVFWITIAALPAWAIITSFFAQAVRKRGQAARAAGSLVTGTIEEGMDNVLAVQSLGGNREERGRFDSDSREAFRRHRRVTLLWILIGKAGEIFGRIVEIAFAIYIIYKVVGGEMSPGDFGALMVYMAYLRGPAMSVGTLWIRLQDNVAGMRRVFAMMDLEAEDDLGTTPLPRIERGVHMRDVSLVFPDGRRALDHVNFAASVGQIVALVGPTGAGKTSLAYLIPRFHVATEGRIEIDDHDVNDVTLETLRDQVTYVFQETQLFSDSILDNIRYGKPDASMDEVERVARIAGVHEFIASLPEGYDTELGQGAQSKLSVGQKQRIAIARGLVRDSRILILDEPTSALDPETENHLVASLHEAAKDRLVIIIAHRLSTIAHADKIVFMEDGRVLEEGSHHELLNRADGHYRRFVDLQTRSAEANAQ